MNAFLPSEISRLIYGYLSSHCGQNLAEEFFNSCPSMAECRLMKNTYSRNSHTTVQDLTLETILDQYSKLCSLIFKCVDENDRVHRNVLHLLERLLNKPEASGSNTRVFKDVQNVQPNRYCDQLSNEARGRECKSSVSSMSVKSKTKNCCKEPVSIQSNGQIASKLLEFESHNVSLPVARVSSDVILDTRNDHSLHQTVQFNADPQSDLFNQKSTPSSLIAEVRFEDTIRSFDHNRSNLTNPSEKIYVLSIPEISDSTKGIATRQDDELEEPVPAKRRLVEVDISSNLGTDFGDEAQSSSSVNSSSSISKSTRDDGNPVERNELPISKDEVPSEPAEMVPSVQTNCHKPSPFASNFKIPTPPSSQKAAAIEVKSVESPAKIKKPNSNEEYIQVFFDNMSKGFKQRQDLFSSPAKSNVLLHRAILSPFSKMYVTPTKPNIVASSLTVASNQSNTTGGSSTSSDRRSIFSPVPVGSPSPKVSIPISKDAYSEEKLYFGPPSTQKQKILAKRKECHLQKSPFCNPRPKIVKKEPTSNAVKELHPVSLFKILAFQYCRRQFTFFSFQDSKSIRKCKKAKNRDRTIKKEKKLHPTSKIEENPLLREFSVIFFTNFSHLFIVMHQLLIFFSQFRHQNQFNNLRLKNLVLEMLQKFLEKIPEET